MKLWQEKYYPWVIAIISAIASSCFLTISMFEKIIQGLMSPAINVAAITIGFLATMKTVLVAIDHRPIIEALRNCGYYDYLLDYFLSAIRGGFVVVIVSAIGMIFDTENVPNCIRYFIPIWISAVTYTIFAGYRVLQVMSTILRGTFNKK